MNQIKQLMTRENHRRAKQEAGIVIRPKGRPRKTAQSEAAKHEQEVKELRMTVELLRNFLYEAGRR